MDRRDAELEVGVPGFLLFTHLHRWGHNEYAEM